MAALDHRDELPQAAYGRAWPAPTPKKTVTASAVATASAEGVGRSKAATRGYPHASPTPSPSASIAPAKGPRCAPSDIVLSLFTGQPSYGQDASPTFDVYAVSTSAAACTLSYGPGAVQVVVTRRRAGGVGLGRVQAPAAAGAVHPRRSAGALDHLEPPGQRPAGCAGTLPAGSSGTFDAVAMTDGQSSPVRSFKLAG